MEQNLKVVALQKNPVVKFFGLPDGAWFIIPAVHKIEGEVCSGLCVKMNGEVNALNSYAIDETIHTFICPIDADVRRVFPTITYYEE